MSDFKPVLNVDEAEFMDWGHGERFKARLAPLSPRLRAQKLGYNVVRLPAGKIAWPYHFHHVNEELFVILEGTGKVRINDQEHDLRAGDLIACPPGPDGAHQIRADEDSELLYLAISTSESPEIAEYPDTGKLGVLAALPGEEGLRAFFPKDGQVNYWEGE